MNIKINLMLLFGFFSLGLNAQTTIKGKIIGYQNKSLSDCEISISETNQKTTSDIDGNFSFENIQNGTYTLVFTAIGYEETTKQIKISNDANSDLEIYLTKLDKVLQTVEIIGRKSKNYKSNYSFATSKIAVPITEIPQSISTITNQLIRDKQAFRFDEVSKNVAGVSSNSNGNSVFLRGFENSNYLLNGLRTSSQWSYSSSILPHIESYEVVKGPSSSTFGNVSPGGVVNVITKKPLAENKQQIAVSSGSFDTYRIEADLTGKLSKNGKFLYRFNTAGQLAKQFFDNSNDDALVIAPSISYLPSSSTRINVDFVHTIQSTSISPYISLFDPNQLDDLPINFSLYQKGDFQKIKNTTFAITLSQNITKNITFNTAYQFYTYQFKQDYIDGYEYVSPTELKLYGIKWDGNNFDTNNITSYFNADFKTGIFNHKLLVGYDYNNLLFNGGIFKNSDDTNVNIIWDKSQPNSKPFIDKSTLIYYEQDLGTTKDYSSGIYIQDNISIGEKLKLMVGLRQENFKYRINYNKPEQQLYSFTTLLPKAGITYQLPQNTFVYASFLTGFQPVISQYYLYAKREDGKDFVPETSQQFEIGIKKELFNKKLLVTTAVFNIEKDNVFQLVSRTTTPWVARQTGSVRSRGFEVEANGQITPNWSISANFAYTDAKITNDADETRIGLPLGGSIKNMGGFWTKYSFTTGNLSGFGIGAGLNSKSSNPTKNFPDQSIKGYTTIDFALYYEKKKFNLSVNFNNFTNVKYVTSALANNEFIYRGLPFTAMTRLAYKFN